MAPRQKYETYKHNTVQKILIWEAEHNCIRKNQTDNFEDNFVAQMFEKELSETDAGDAEKLGSSGTDLELDGNTFDSNRKIIALSQKKKIVFISKK